MSASHERRACSRSKSPESVWYFRCSFERPTTYSFDVLRAGRWSRRDGPLKEKALLRALCHVVAAIRWVAFALLLKTPDHGL